MSVALLHFLGQPEDSLTSHLGGKVPVEGCWGAALVMDDIKCLKKDALHGETGYCQVVMCEGVTNIPFSPDLLHVTQDVLTAVKHSFSLLRVQVVDEIRCVMGVAALISAQKCTCM